MHAADVEPGPDTPCILTGYGGFAIANSPMWSPPIAAWCERGGLYAIAGLRGGLEEGEAWHRAGRRDTKQNVFDDFLAAADFLVDSRLTVAIAPRVAGRVQRRSAGRRGPDPAAGPGAAPCTARCRCSTWSGSRGS